MADEKNTSAIRGLDRRTLLRTSLLAGFGAAAVGSASTLLAGTASAAQPAGVDPPGSSTPQQFDWGWCNACAGLFFAHNDPHAGECPAPSPYGADVYQHAVVNDVLYTSYNYGIYYNGSGTDYQPNWCYCSNCSGLFHQGSGSNPNGICPNGGTKNTGHVNSGYPYLVYYGSVSGVGQPNWLWCSQCYGMFFAGTNPKKIGGACPLDGEGKYAHNGSTSFPYQLTYSGSLDLGISPTITDGPISG
jgi:hypothetical protein